ncbi:TonB-dependent receptor [Schlegelella sp. ID0723]|uniref:TonB-dependent receptor n=1 Tax=Piscinibacter koreensis TaxID=2742824 RepID=A0A7Y6NNZ6_9BURK|nr:TonB-dependent receptor [Schlegelella koreensis]
MSATIALAALPAAASAQGAAAPASGEGSAPPAPSAPANAEAPAAAPATLEKIVITGSRIDETTERRESTAAKIVVGRDEIERHGDTTLGDVLKRLPGITVDGRPGRGGAIRMRGLGAGYTQILLDGERVPPGFSIDSLSPQQVERIEILRAPTAETGARAIAGTINIITRDGASRRINDLQVATSVEDGRAQARVAWTRNDRLGPLTFNHSLSAFRQSLATDSTTRTRAVDLDGGATLLDQRLDATAREHRSGLHATGRLQWRGSEPGHSVVLTPFLVVGRGDTRRTGALAQAVPTRDCSAGPSPPEDPTPLCPYDESRSDGSGRYAFGRLNGAWLRRLTPDARIELRSGIGLFRNTLERVATERTDGLQTRRVDDDATTRDRNLTASGKVIALLAADHNVVAGVEAESNRRLDRRTTLQNGRPLLVEFGDDVEASATRLAAYAQDEWNVTPNWAAHVGLRWEGIATRSSASAETPRATNRSSVWSPLLHALWKPDPKSRDQVRISLTRSYRSPGLADLIARPVPNARYPIDGRNTATQPDRAGNPELRPELATGVDVALERYLDGGGVLSASVFQRWIRDFMRSQTTLETVPWSSQPRYVARPRNIGDAVTQGIELEAKFRLSQLVDGAPRTDLRLNASAFRSRVRSVPGPDNRLDRQPTYVLNAGADHRFTAVPLAVGGNINGSPGYRTRISELQTVRQGRKLVLDAYALWIVSPSLQLRMSASNLNPLDEVTGSVFDDVRSIDGRARSVRETSTTTTPSSLNLQLRLEAKL